MSAAPCLFIPFSAMRRFDLARARRVSRPAAGIRVFSPEHYTICDGGGMLAAHATHLAITPLNVLKVTCCRRQRPRMPGCGQRRDARRSSKKKKRCHK
ncbi:hypothetical protein PVAP13_1NG456700 [Panicum virgatum]|uniref:Uncharacterized protein n=1 Tax=Panicum virgatum TaxID=38727 RepID=A0A8T0X6D7_PANVG|nr:hypothetical protein PVAP13_1NG456700 [Panicum virgatum]